MTKIIAIGIIAFALFAVQRYVYQRMWNKSLYVKVDFTSTQMFQGETGQLKEVVENRKRLPLPVLKVKFQTDRNLVFGEKDGSKVTDLFYWNDVFQVGGGEKITRTLNFTAKKRGYYKVLGIDLVFSPQRWWRQGTRAAICTCIPDLFPARNLNSPCSS